jgi:hypothetical protein
MKKIVCLVAGLAWQTSAIAFFCPTNFSQIDFGMTKDQVISVCGKANKEESTTVTATAPQTWTYFVPLSDPSRLSKASNGQTGTVNTQFYIDANGIVNGISVNGSSINATALCGGNIQLGDSKDKIKSVCGSPTSQTQSVTPDDKKPPVKRVTLTYQGTSTVKLIFENDKLVSRE